MQKEAYILLKIEAFLIKIGIKVVYQNIENETFLPGYFIKNGLIIVEIGKAKYIGDLLHEAGHIALMKPQEREILSGKLDGQVNPEANEMAVIAWTYAACLEIGLDPAIVFHENGYHGNSESILENFKNGRYFGVPILQWYGLTHEKIDLSKNINTAYPKMKTWVRI